MDKIPVVTVFCASCVLVVFCAPSTKMCPSGGRYFDKHIGQNGRWMCCSEICEPMIYQSMCNKKCPGYEDLKASGSRIMNKTDPTPKPTPADTKDPTVSQPELKPPVRSSSDSNPAAAGDQQNRPKAGGTSDTIVVSVLGTGVAILLTILLIVLFVQKLRRQQKGRGQGNGLEAGISMNTLHRRPPTENPETRYNLLHGSRPEDPAAETTGGPGNAGAGHPRLSQSEGRPLINPDQHSQRLGSSFIQTAKEEGIPIQVADGSSGAMAME